LPTAVKMCSFDLQLNTFVLIRFFFLFSFAIPESRLYQQHCHM
jgi:hypothetical protein